MATTYQIVKFANAHHDAMTMVSRDSAFRVASPRKTLETYLRLGKQLGVTMHNDSWERHAWRFVERAEARRKQAVQEMVARA